MMNERIKELAEQADLHSTLYFRKDQLRKFAESIVRECAKVVFDKTGPKSALDVLEHFGVEE